MKKFLFLGLILLLLVNAISAVDVAYITKSSGTPDGNFIKGMNELGYTYDIVDDSNIRKTDFSKYNVILIGDGYLSDYDKIPVRSVNTLIVNGKSSHLKSWGVISKDSSSNYLSTSQFEKGRIIPNEVITKGLSSPMTLYNNRAAKVALLPKDTSLIALGLKKVIISDNYNRVALGYIERNGKLLGNVRSNSKIIYFGIPESEYWTEDTLKLFKNSLTWLLGNDDDNDGYYSIESGGSDCNDNDPNINPGSSDITKNCVNDAPKIEKFYPGKDEEVLKNVDKEFKVVVKDETDVTYSWEVNGANVGSLDSFIFNGDVGNYVIKVSVSDGELKSENVWNIEVKDSSLFTCSELGGKICSGGEICDLNVVISKDSNACCKGTCALRFSNIKKRCESKSDNIEIEITGIDGSYYVGDKIDATVKIKNNRDKKMDFKLDNYFYDLNENKIIDKFNDKFSINKEENSETDLEFNLPYIVDENNGFSLYVYAENEDNECREEIVKFDVLRNEREIYLEKFSLSNGPYSCGDNIELKMTVKNIGTLEQDTYVQINNRELEVDLKSDTFLLEGYGGNDDKNLNFILEIADYADAGEYPLDVDIVAGGEIFNFEKAIVLENCKRKVTSEQTIDVSNLNSKLQQASNWKETSFMFIILLEVSIFIVVFLVLNYYLKRV